jgi:hypothetical protein
MINIERTIEHPLEEALDIEPGTTIVPVTNAEIIQASPSPLYDEKDTEIDTQLQQIYELATSEFNNTLSDAQFIENPKYRVILQEQAVGYLNTALNAAKEKKDFKVQKDKLNLAKEKVDSARTVNNNLIVADRNDILKALFAQDRELKE